MTLLERVLGTQQILLITQRKLHKSSQFFFNKNKFLLLIQAKLTAISCETVIHGKAAT